MGNTILEHRHDLNDPAGDSKVMSRITWRDQYLKQRNGSVYSIKLAATPQDRSDVFTLRYRVYCQEMRSLDPAQYPDGQEKDAYDDRAALFIARMDDEPVGTIRVSFEQEGKYLMETSAEGFSLPDWLPRDSTCEPSRLVARRIVTLDADIRQSTLLLGAACRWCLQNRFTFWTVAWQQALYEKLKKEGWPFIELGEPQAYHNTTVVPVALDLRTLHQKVFSI